MLNIQARNAKGFLGFISLNLRDEPDVAVILTLWEDEESLVSSETAVFSKAVDQIKHFLERKPDVEQFRVFSTKLFMCPT